MEEYGASLERGSSVKEKMAGPTFTKAKSSSNSTRKHERSRQSVSRCFVLRRERFYGDAPYDDRERASCWCCPLQGIGELRTLHNDFPDLWARLKVMDEKSTKYRFRKDYTLQQLERMFDDEEKQQRLSLVEGKDGI